LPRLALQFLCATLLVCLLALLPVAQTSGPPPVVKSIQLVEDHGVPAIEILSAGGRVTPEIQTLTSPPRLLIDLPNSRLGGPAKRTAIDQQNVEAILAYQYQKRPPVTRIIVDMLAPYGYTWEIVSNRLLIRLKPPESGNAAVIRGDAVTSSQPPVETNLPLGLAPGARPAAVPVTGGSGTLVLAGSRFAAGSSLTAGSETAILRLSRGGQVFVCPGTSVSITPSHNQRDLMLALSVGALEAHYSLAASADSLLTPDFRIMFAGPGHFDFAISADSHGNTCVRALKGNTSSAIVSELMGDRIYQVRPAEQAVFRSGRIDRIDTDIPLECGCPPPSAVLLANAAATPPLSDSVLPEITRLGGTSASSVSASGEIGSVFGGNVRTTLSNGLETAPLPPSQPNDVHVQVNASFVLSGNGPALPQPFPPLAAAADLPLADSSARPVHLDPVIQSPLQEKGGDKKEGRKEEAQARTEHRSFLRRVGGFFASIFR